MTLAQNNCAILGLLAGIRLSIGVVFGKGLFSLPEAESEYHVIAKYSYEAYPASPNGSDYHVAGLAIMPHFERSILPWNWANYPAEQKADVLSPWIQAFINAKDWVAEKV